VAADLERALELALATELPADAAATIDRRVRAAMVGTAPTASTRRGWRRRRVIAGFAIAALVAGAGATPAIRDHFDGWLGGTFESIWDRATVIDQAVEDQGYRVTLVRAYADPAGLRLALAAEDLQQRPDEEIAVGSAHVTAEGTEFPASMAEGSFAGHTVDSDEAIVSYVVPPEFASPGIRQLTATVGSIGVRRAAASGEEIDPADLWSSVAGEWRFEFDLEFFGAVSAEPGLTASSGGVDVTLRTLSVMPSATIGVLEFRGLPVVERDWGWDPMLKVEHDGRTLDVWSLSPGLASERMQFEIQEGFDDLSGTWTITITEFRRDIPDPDSDITTRQESIVGPWVLAFEGQDEAPSPTP
jgi:hypothetical protein